MKAQLKSPWGVSAQGVRGAHQVAPQINLDLVENANILTLAPFRNQLGDCTSYLADNLSLDWPQLGRITTNGQLLAAWNGYSDIMLIGPKGNLMPYHIANALIDRAAIVDQSSGRVLFYLSGVMANYCLMKLIEIDVHPSIFKPNMGAITKLHHISVGVFKLSEDPMFLIHCARSYAGDVWHSIVEAGEEFGISMHTKLL